MVLLVLIRGPRGCDFCWREGEEGREESCEGAWLSCLRWEKCVGVKFFFLFKGSFHGVAVKDEMGEGRNMFLRVLMIEMRKWDLIEGLGSDVRGH